jgi:hypothetical protein
VNPITNTPCWLWTVINSKGTSVNTPSGSQMMHVPAAMISGRRHDRWAIYPRCFSNKRISSMANIHGTAGNVRADRFEGRHLCWFSERPVHINYLAEFGPIMACLRKCSSANTSTAGGPSSRISVQKIDRPNASGSCYQQTDQKPLRTAIPA